MKENKGSTLVKQLIRDLEDGVEVDSQFIVREHELKKKKNGDDYLNLRFSDTSGIVRAVAWDDVQAISANAKQGAVVRATGLYKVDERYGAQITISELEPVQKDDVQLSDLVDRPVENPEELEDKLWTMIGSVQDQNLRALLERLFNRTSDFWPDFVRAPAAKMNHEPYEHGLLEHTVTISEAVNAASNSFAEINSDLALAGALVHDIGKVDAYQIDEFAIDFTDSGRLQGEIPIGYYRLRRAIDETPSFPTELAQKLLHIQLSHHGKREYGSPVEPQTREATLVHAIDNLGGKLGGYNRLERQLAEGQQWSNWDSMLEGFAYFA